MVLGTWQKRVEGLVACTINLLTGRCKVYPMVEEAVQGAEAGAGAGAGGGVDAEGEEAFSKLDAFPQEKNDEPGFGSDRAALEEYPAGASDALRFSDQMRLIYT
ncbi:hypothetical protein OIU78_000383 [Salix suchowensis]|nr:hypothetical protein OIU78_000383 [Salix suchowensis]